MKVIAGFLFVLTISSTIKEIHGVKLFGPAVNFSSFLNDIVYMKGIGAMKPNLLPDTTYNDKPRERVPGADAAVGRRFLKDNIIADRRKVHFNANLKFLDEGVINDYEKLVYNDDEEIVDNENEKMVDNDDEKTVDKDDKNITFNKDHPEIDYDLIFKELRKRILRAAAAKLSKRRENHVATDRSAFLKYQSECKMEEIKTFLNTHYLVTDYIYDEVQRIKRDHVLKDPLREMVDYLSEPNREGLTKSVFQCFKDRRKIDIPPRDIWKNRITNNLVITPIL